MSTRKFELGLVMAGAISGGAYAAGVVDFLIEALDEWEAAKARGEAVPDHETTLSVVTGASAGAIAGAIAAVTFGAESEPVRDVDQPPPPERSRLFDAWVRQIDIAKLLGTSDLEQAEKVVSVLDSLPLETIALDALKMQPRSAARRYLADPLPILLTVSNLRGVPYGFKLFGTRPDTLYGMSEHMDHMRFAMSAKGCSGAPDSRPLDPADLPGGGGWPDLAQAALASGAFPIGLASRILNRPFADYEKRLGRPPAFGTPPPPDPYVFLSVDGGVIDNEPLELARRELSGGADRRNPRRGEEACRAVLLVDPFPNELAFAEDYRPDDRMVNVARGLISSLIDQARFKPEELALAETTSVFSRFMISPSRTDAQDQPVEPAMAAAILGGFGAFLHEDFRRHDFQLGRRNCQAFLKWHFHLPDANPLFAGMPEAMRSQFALRAQDQPDAAGGSPLLPIIPLVGTAAIEVLRPPPPDGSVVDQRALQKQIETRLTAIGKVLIDTELAHVAGGFRRWLMKQGYAWLVVDRLTEAVMEAVRRELQRLS